MTKAQLASESGSALLEVLERITSDGELSLGEIGALRSWLEERGEDSSVPAIAWLGELTEGVLRDGRVTQSERVDLILGIERVMPKPARLGAQARRARANQIGAGSTAPPLRSTSVDSATPAQLRYLAALGGTPTTTLTKAEASAEIDRRLCSAASVSNRQMMVLRFWNRLDVADRGRSGVSEWMDEHYDADPDHQAAWKLWKEDSDDRGRQDDPQRVPIGIGSKYLRRVKGGRLGCLLLILLPLVGIATW